MGKRKKKFLLISGILLVFVVFISLVLTKKIRLTSLWADRYDVQGVDVSHYQGDIDWQILQRNQIDFAYIKATEGSSHIDEKFEVNWQEASKTNVTIGAYHFFSFDSPGKEQAEGFIDSVGNLSGKLPPVVDIEYYGNREANPPDEETVIENLQEMLDVLEQKYQVKPIIYTTYKVYKKYIRDNFEAYPLWLRNVYYIPNLDLSENWVFWQYSDTSVMEGYNGEEKYIDRNVFCGSKEELEDLLID